MAGPVPTRVRRLFFVGRAVEATGSVAGRAAGGLSSAVRSAGGAAVAGVRGVLARPAPACDPAEAVTGPATGPSGRGAVVVAPAAPSARRAGSVAAAAAAARQIPAGWTQPSWAAGLRPGVGRRAAASGRSRGPAAAPAAREPDEFRGAAIDVGVVLRQLGPAIGQLAPVLGEFAPLLPVAAASSMRVVAALSPLAPAVGVTMPAVAECAVMLAQNVAEQLPRLAPRLQPVGKDLGTALVAIWPLLVPTGELVVSASHLLGATFVLAEGLAPMLVQALPPAAFARTRAQAAADAAITGIAAGLRGLPLAGSAEQVRSGALSGGRAALVWTTGSLARLLPTLAPPAQAGATQALVAALPVISPVTAHTADVLTRVSPSLVPAVRCGTRVASAVTDRLTDVVVVASRVSAALGGAAGYPGGYPAIPAVEPPVRTRGGGRNQAPTVNIVIYVGTRPPRS
jgi:hypothetical protein